MVGMPLVCSIIKDASDVSEFLNHCVGRHSVSAVLDEVLTVGRGDQYWLLRREGQ